MRGTDIFCTEDTLVKKTFASLFCGGQQTLLLFLNLLVHHLNGSVVYVVQKAASGGLLRNISSDASFFPYCAMNR